jgi:hypothetical protein
MPTAAQTTVTIKHLAAALAAQHEMAKKQSGETQRVVHFS